MIDGVALRAFGNSIMRSMSNLVLGRGAAALASAAIALTGMLAVAPLAHAGQEPVVIPGIGPAAAARPVRAREPGPGDFGGGFIDFMLTGYSGEPRAGAPPLRERVAPAAEPASVAAPQMAALSADPGVESEGRGAVDPQFRRQEVAYEGHERPG